MTDISQIDRTPPWTHHLTDNGDLVFTVQLPGGVLTTTLSDFQDGPPDEATIQSVGASIARQAAARATTSTTVRRKTLPGGWDLWVHVNTGPPTWWLPRIKPEKYGLMVGWLRGLVAIAVRPPERAGSNHGEDL